MDKIQAVWHAISRMGYKTEEDFQEELEDFFKKKIEADDHKLLEAVFFMFEGHLFVEPLLKVFVDDFSTKVFPLGYYRVLPKGQNPIRLTKEETIRLERQNNLQFVSLKEVMEYLKLPVVK